MKTIDCTTLYLPFLCKALNYMATPLAQCITLTEDGKPIAGVIYDGYNGTSISCHIWIDAERTPTREWYCAIFDYPFNRLGLKKLIGQVNSSNVEARRLDEHFGFKLEAVITDQCDTGDLLIYTMTPQQCRMLNAPLWQRSMNIVRAV